MKTKKEEPLTCMYCGTYTTNKVGFGIYFEFFEEPVVMADEFYICKVCADLNLEPFKNTHFTILKDKSCYEILPKQEILKAPKTEELN